MIASRFSRALPARAGNESGQSVSVFLVLATAAIILATGLVVDGGQQIAAQSHAESVAAAAARAGANAAATGAVANSFGASAAFRAAQSFLTASPGVTGQVRLVAGRVLVQTSTSSPTIFLSLLGIDQVTGRGQADAAIVGVGGAR